jgi:hypothetical protein
LSRKNLSLDKTIILFDRDYGVSFFQNFKGYNNLLDDAEWLLERTAQKSRGFLIRIIYKESKVGLWFGEYNYNGNHIKRENFLFGNNVANLSNAIINFSEHKISVRQLKERLKIEDLKKNFESEIIQDFKYFICPKELYFLSCFEVKNIYEELVRTYGKGRFIHYSRVSQEIGKSKKCENVIFCPFLKPNHFERILNFNKAIKIRHIGEIKIVGSENVEIV